MIYVDNYNFKYVRMIMNYMIADSVEELHEMADKIGIKRKWFQNHKKYPHYDICLAKKKLAIKYEAEEISTRELIKRFKDTFII